MTRCGTLAVLALALAAPAAAEDRVLAGGEPAPEAAAPADVLASPETAADADRPWKLCRVRISLLLASGGRTEVVSEEERLLFHGETLDATNEVPLEAAGRSALLRLRARVRAALARKGGVVYHVTTQSTLASAIGFASDEVGLDQTRHSYLEIDDTSTHLHEAWVSPGIGARLVMGLAVTPVFGRETEDALAGIVPAEMGPLVSIRVESLLRAKGKVSLLEQADLTARLGHDAVFSMSRLGAQKPPKDPEHPLGGQVIVRDLGVLPDSGYGDSHAVPLRPLEQDYKREHAVLADERYVSEHEVPLDASDDPRSFTMKAKTRKLSERQKQRIRARQEIAEVKRMADERSRTLPSGGEVPSGFQREEFALHLTPLHLSAEYVQLEVRLSGWVKLPGEDAPTTLETSFVEELERGQPFEMGLVDLARGGEPDYDYVFRILVQP